MHDLRVHALVTLGKDGLLLIASTNTINDAGGELSDEEFVRRKSLAVAGGFIFLDAAAEPHELNAAITDLGAAAWWVELVFGEQALGDIHRIADAGLAGPEAVHWTAGELYRSVVRLLFGLWLRDFWPSARTDIIPLAGEEELELGAELGVVAWTAEPLFGDATLARELLLPSVDIISDGVARLALETDVTGDTESDKPPLLVTAARAFLDSCELDDPGYDDVERALELLSSLDSAGARAFLTRRGSKPSDYALAAGDTDTLERLAARAYTEPVRTGPIIVDWRLVHPRLVHGAPTAASWHLRESATDDSHLYEIEIEVEADGPARYHPSLFARVFVESLEFAIVHLQPEGFSYSGFAELPGFTSIDQITVELGSSDRATNPPMLPQRTEDTEASNALVLAVARARRATVVSGAADAGDALAPFGFERY